MVERRTAQILGGQMSVGTEGDDPPSGVSVRIDIEVAGNPVQARSMLRDPTIVNGFIHQLTRMRDEVWGPQSTNSTPKTAGAVDVVHQPSAPEDQRWGITVSGHVVTGCKDQDQAGKLASKLRGRLAENVPMPQALIDALGEM